MIQPLISDIMEKIQILLEETSDFEVLEALLKIVQYTCVHFMPSFAPFFNVRSAGYFLIDRTLWICS